MRSASSRARRRRPTSACTTRSPRRLPGQFKGGTDLVFNLKNHGVGLGKINPVVPASWIKLMNSYRTKIVAGTLKVPSGL